MADSSSDASKSGTALGSRPKDLFWIAKMAVVVGVVWLVVAPDEKPLSSAPPKEESDTTIDVPPAMVERFRDVLLYEDYTCPRIAIVRAKGLGPRGQYYKVWCGPADQPGQAYAFAYAVLIANNGDLYAQIWSDD
ncbi:MAG: hypothetical protein DCC73_14890 [Proteobacteria bacterium]|nr:MAG: hypothetical protein DCC73_14890 [Pseudomonadota bacterium]